MLGVWWLHVQRTEVSEWEAVSGLWLRQSGWALRPLGVVAVAPGLQVT